MSTAGMENYPEAIAVLPKKYQEFYEESCKCGEWPDPVGRAVEAYRYDQSRSFFGSSQKSHAKKSSEKLSESQPKNKVVDNGNWMKVKKDLTKQSKLKKSLRGPLMLLIYFLEHRPWAGKADRHHTQKYWYSKKGLIVASRSVRRMSEDLGVNESTIKRWVKALKNDGLIQVAKENGENIYAVGKVVDGTDIFFYELER